MPHYIALHRPQYISHCTVLQYNNASHFFNWGMCPMLLYLFLGLSQLPLWLLVGNQMPVLLFFLGVKSTLWGKKKVVFRVKCTSWEALRYQWSVSLWCEGPEWSRSQPRATSPPVKTFFDHRLCFQDVYHFSSRFFGHFENSYRFAFSSLRVSKMSSASVFLFECYNACRKSINTDL